jgi:FtsH-binding integral membrane protein
LEPRIIRVKVLPALFWLIFLMFAGAKLVEIAMQGAFGVYIAQLTIGVFESIWTTIGVIVLYFVFALAAYFIAMSKHNRISFVVASLFALVCGAGLFSTVFYLADFINAKILPEALLLSAGVFFIAMVWEWTTKKDLTNWGFWIFLFLLAAIVLTIAQAFVQVTLFRVAVDLGVVLLFAFIVAYDTHLARERLDDDSWMMAVLNFFIDFINIFIRIIVILMELYGRRK